jgi:SAM-dependent methyltransferase
LTSAVASETEDKPVNIYVDGAYRERNPTWHEEHSGWKADHIARILAANAIAPRSLAEVGCGAGQILVELDRKLPTLNRLVGYEVSPQAFALCNGKAGGKIAYFQHDVVRSPPSERYDVVLAIDVFEHVDDYLGFIRGLARVGRYKVFHIPLELSVSSMLRAGALDRARAEVGHIHYFTRQTALATIRDAGFRILDERFTSISIDHAELLKTKLLRLPRKAIAALAPDFAARLLGGFGLLVLAE